MATVPWALCGHVTRVSRRWTNHVNCCSFLVGNHYNMSSCLRITDDYDQLSPGLVEKATAAGHWKSGNFNFKHAFSAEYDGLSITETQKPEHRQTDGEKLMTNMSKDGKCSIYVNAPFCLFTKRGRLDHTPTLHHWSVFHCSHSSFISIQYYFDPKSAYSSAQL